MIILLYNMDVLPVVDRMSLADYLNGAPNNGMYKYICKILDKTPSTAAKKDILELAGNVRFSDFKN